MTLPTVFRLTYSRRKLNTIVQPRNPACALTFHYLLQQFMIVNTQTPSKKDLVIVTDNLKNKHIQSKAHFAQKMKQFSICKARL